MSQIQLDAHDINTLLNKFVGPNCRFEGGLIKLSFAGVDATLSETVLTTKAAVNVEGLKIEANQVSLDASGAKISFGIKG